jgi:hypothetical protein
MGEGTNGVNPIDQAAQAEREVVAVRDRLTGIVRELERRRHAVLDLRAQIRRHAPALGISAGTLALLAGGAIWLGVWMKARRGRPLARAHRLRLALARTIAHPDQVARPRQGLGHKALSALVTAAVGVLAKTLMQRAVTRLKLAPAPAS